MGTSYYHDYCKVYRLHTYITDSTVTASFIDVYYQVTCI